MTALPTQSHPDAASQAILLKTLANDGVLRLTLNRPSQRNPLSQAMLAALQAALDDAAGDNAVRAIIIAANGPGFCGGHDLREMTAHRGDPDGGRAHFEQTFSRCATLMQTIVNHPHVIVAEVQGIATAAGCQLVAACDLAVASNMAQFGVNGINSGLFCSTPMVALSRNIPRKRAMALLTLGELMSAEEALEVGLVNEVVEPEDLTAAGDELAGRLASRAAAVLKLGKQAFYRQLEMPLDEAYAFTSRVIVDNMLMDDAVEGIGAFLDKRKPEWKS
jgi:enoyl-CoA hydratase/carnithine racemase